MMVLATGMPYAASTCLLSNSVRMVRPSARDLATMLSTSLRSGAQVAESRSEEHTPELHSPRHLVCRLLLEKKDEHRWSATEPRTAPGLRHVLSLPPAP